jgi:hypothetical protein
MARRSRNQRSTVLGTVKDEPACGGWDGLPPCHRNYLFPLRA